MVIFGFADTGRVHEQSRGPARGGLLMVAVAMLFLLVPVKIRAASIDEIAASAPVPAGYLRLDPDLDEDLYGQFVEGFDRFTVFAVYVARGMDPYQAASQGLYMVLGAPKINRYLSSKGGRFSRTVVKHGFRLAFAGSEIEREGDSYIVYRARAETEKGVDAVVSLLFIQGRQLQLISFCPPMLAERIMDSHEDFAKAWTP